MNLIRKTFTNRQIWKDTRRIFWFSAFTTLLGTLNLFADEFIAGNLGPDTIKAIAVVDFNLVVLNAVGAFLSIGLRGHLSQALTTGKNKHAQKTFDFSLAITLFMIVISVIIMWLLKDILIHWRTNDKVVISQANDYYFFIVAAHLTQIFSNKFNIFLIVKGYQGRITIVNVLSILVNIIISIILCYVYDFGIIGTAIGTISSVVFSLFIKWILIFSLRKDFEISLGPWRFLFVKLGQIKVLKKTWVYLPYETIFFILAIVQTWILGKYFNNGLLLIAMSASISFAIVGISGSGTLMTKMVSPLLGKNELTKAKEMTEQILIVSTIRSTMVSLVYVSIFGLALPYIHIYEAPFVSLQRAGWIVFGYGLVAGIMAPSFYTGYFLAGISGNPLRTAIIDLSMSVFSIGIFFACQAVSNSWISLMLAQILYRVSADVIMVTNVFKKNQYVSLKRKWLKLGLLPNV